jgi:NADH:ubiquinone oxidoreductase subunit K
MSALPILISAVSALSLYGVLTQRGWLGVLIGVQGLFGAVIVALVALPRQPGSGSEIGLMVLVISQVQALAALGFAARLHFMRVRPEMSELRSMRN